MIGADGLRSTVRSVAFGDEALRYSGFTIWRGVVPLDDTLGSRIHPAESWGRRALFGVTLLRGSQAFWYATVRADENVGFWLIREKIWAGPSTFLPSGKVNDTTRP